MRVVTLSPALPQGASLDLPEEVHVGRASAIDRWAGQRPPTEDRNRRPRSRLDAATATMSPGFGISSPPASRPRKANTLVINGSCSNLAAVRGSATSEIVLGLIARMDCARQDAPSNASDSTS